MQYSPRQENDAGDGSGPTIPPVDDPRSAPSGRIDQVTKMKRYRAIHIRLLMAAVALACVVEVNEDYGTLAATCAGAAAAIILFFIERELTRRGINI
jgi:hypothetical protein